MSRLTTELSHSVAPLVSFPQTPSVQVNKTHDEGADDDGGSAQVVPEKAVGMTSAQIAHDRNPEEVRNRHRALNKTPGARKVSRSHLLVNVDFERVVVSANGGSVSPHEDDVAIVALDGREAENGDAGEQKSRLTQVLTRDATLSRSIDDEKAESGATDGPSAPEVHLEHEDGARLEAVESRIANEVDERRKEAERGHGRRGQNDLDGARAQRRPIEKRRPIVLSSILFFVL